MNPLPQKSLSLRVNSTPSGSTRLPLQHPVQVTESLQLSDCLSICLPPLPPTCLCLNYGASTPPAAAVQQGWLAPDPQVFPIYCISTVSFQILYELLGDLQIASPPLLGYREGESERGEGCRESSGQSLWRICLLKKTIHVFTWYSCFSVELAGCSYTLRMKCVPVHTS